MYDLVISPLQVADDIEVVERKGAGHPDTICDALAETLSRNLCNEYQRRFGQILHHNVDKALLSGGHSIPAFSGGRVIEPIRIHLAGRAVAQVGNDLVPIEEIAVEGSRAWLRANLHALDAEREVRIETLVHQGSQDLQALFSRGTKSGIPLANDTSFGVGHAPLSALERFTLAVEQRLHSRDRAGDRPAWGEDIKVMAVRQGDKVQVTAACAMIGRYLGSVDDYLEQKVLFTAFVRSLAAEHGFSDCAVSVNAADDVSAGSVYLTVTGTSAEAGDDGQVGRGNRVNGLITPCRPMSLEGAAGKNAVSHVAKYIMCWRGTSLTRWCVCARGDRGRAMPDGQQDRCADIRAGAGAYQACDPRRHSRCQREKACGERGRGPPRAVAGSHESLCGWGNQRVLRSCQKPSLQQKH